VLLDLAQLTGNLQEQTDYCLKALQIMPDRREAIAFLTMIMIDSKRYIAAMSWARMMMAVPKPLGHYWTHKAEWYGWKAYRLWAQCLRLNGHEKEANDQEAALFEAGKKKISLLHATRGRPQPCVNAMMQWLNFATNAAQVEHIFGIDEDDKDVVDATRPFKRVILPAGGGSVAAWNKCAEVATGAVLVQMSDDFEPFLGWDEAILSKIGDLEQEKVLAISDGHRKDGLLCMAILTRKRLEKQGHLFFPEYKSVFSDTEFSHRAYKDNVVIDARDLVFKHNNPFFETGKFDADKTYMESNSESRYRTGFELFKSRNPDAICDSVPASSDGGQPDNQRTGAGTVQAIS